MQKSGKKSILQKYKKSWKALVVWERKSCILVIFILAFTTLFWKIRGTKKSLTITCKSASIMKISQESLLNTVCIFTVICSHGSSNSVSKAKSNKVILPIITDILSIGEGEIKTTIEGCL